VSNLKIKHIEVISLLARGQSVTNTAKTTKLTRATIYNWLKNDEFVARLNTLKNEQLESTRTQIQYSATIAVDTLVDVMQKSTSDSARIAAAKEVLSMSGFCKDSLEMYGWGVGGETVEKVKAEKKTRSILDGLASA